MSGPNCRSTSFDFAAAPRSCSRSRLPAPGMSRSMMNFLRAILCLHVSRFRVVRPAWYGFRRGLSRGEGSQMEYTMLGRTGLKVSVAGLGCGGFSQLGLGTGKDETHAIGIIHQALDLGVNLFDTAASYSTEPVLGKALRSVPREEVVICTKA